MRDATTQTAASSHLRIVQVAGITLAAYVVVGGLITLSGWYWHYPRLTDWNNDGISMFVNTALCAVASGFGVLLLQRVQLRWWRRLTIAVLGTFVSLVGALTLYQHLSGVNLGIDMLLLQREWGVRAATSPMRMGPPAATSFFVLGVALHLAIHPHLRGLAAVIAPLPVFIASLSLIGYWYGANQLFGVAKYTGIAFQTSTMVASLGIALLTAIPEKQPIKTLVQESAAGVLARRALPIIILLPLVLGWFRMYGQQQGLYSVEFGTALRTVIEITMLAALIWWAVASVGKYERRLRESEERSRLAQQAAHWGVFEFNYRTGHNYWSPEVLALYGLNPGEFENNHQGWRRRVHPDDIARTERELERASLTGMFAQDFRVLWPDGTVRWIYSCAKVFYDTDNRPLRMVGVNVDITDRKLIEQERAIRADELSAALERRTHEVSRAEKALARAERMAAVGTMASGLAHDMNNVLFPLSGRLDLLLQASTLSGEERDNLTVVAALVDHLRAMSKSLSMFARDPEQEGVEGTTDLVAWSEAVRGLMEASLSGKDGFAGSGSMRLQWDIPRGLPLANVAPHRLTQAVMNLVHNARDAVIISHERDRRYNAGCITVAARLLENEPLIALKVIDDGCGMDDATVRRSIEPFFTTKDRPIAAGMGGSGMGLALANAICERVGGRLDIESKPGHGTAVTMLLPIVLQRDVSHHHRDGVPDIVITSPRKSHATS